MLHWAVVRKKKDCVCQLVRDDRTNCVLRDNDGRTLLHEVAIRGHTDVVDVLLAKLEILNDINAGDKFRRTALHWAAENGNEKVVRFTRR